MKLNPIAAFFGTLGLFISGRVKFFSEDKGMEYTMEDGEVFSVFRHVKIKPGKKQKEHPEAVFKIRFKPGNISAQKNIKFSCIPMMIFMGFRGFRSKYWMVNYDSGLCQGIYEWQTYDEALNYSKSIAVKFMTNRSEQGTVNFEIIKQGDRKYFPFEKEAVNDK